MMRAGRTSLLLLVVLLGCAGGQRTSAEWSKAWAGAQYHAQDPVSGAYQYGYAGPQHAKSESSFDGVTRGAYSYIEPNGLVQRVSYTADAQHGFRINEPPPPEAPPAITHQDPEIPPVVKRLRPVDWSPPPRRQPLERAPNRGRFLLAQPVAPPLVPTLAMPLIAMPARVLLHTPNRHFQDSFGRYDYSYSADTSAKSESRSLDGTVRGSYSYIDPNGLLREVHYIADQGGFRVLATNGLQARR